MTCSSLTQPRSHGRLVPDPTVHRDVFASSPGTSAAMAALPQSPHYRPSSRSSHYKLFTSVLLTDQMNIRSAFLCPNQSYHVYAGPVCASCPNRFARAQTGFPKENGLTPGAYWRLLKSSLKNFKFQVQEVSRNRSELRSLALEGFCDNFCILQELSSTNFL